MLFDATFCTARMEFECAHVGGPGLESSSPAQNWLSILRNSVVGFDLLGGTRMVQARSIADLLNEYLLNVFVNEKGTTP